MEDWFESHKTLVPVLAGLLLVAACSSPAVTGIKVHIQNSEYLDAITLADSVIAREKPAIPRSGTGAAALSA